MIRVYYPDLANILSIKKICLDGKKAHHILNVLRCKTGQPLVLFNGKNKEYHAVINRIDKKNIWIDLISEAVIQRESPLHIHLIQGVSKGDRMDWVIQKATELGVSRITPIYTQHCAISFKKDHLQKKEEHWNNIIISACEQCGRNTLPALDSIQSFSETIHDAFEGARWILDPHDSHSSTLYSENLNPKKIQLLIGAEGGFSSFEVSQAHQAGFTSLKLGPRILRTETAAIAAIAILQATFGDFTSFRENS